MKSLTKEFRKKDLILGIPLDSPYIMMEYIFLLNSYMMQYLLYFEPTTIYMASVKAIHLQSRGTHDKEHQPKKSLKPHNNKFKGKGKENDKKITTTKKEEGGNPSSRHCEEEGHDDEHYWKLHPKLKTNKFGRNGKKNIV